MGVIVLEDFADDTGALAVAGVRAQSHLRHGVEDAAVDRLETVSSVRQRALHDDAHGVVEIRLPHLGFDAGQPDVAYFHESIPLAWQASKTAKSDISLPQFRAIGREKGRVRTRVFCRFALAAAFRRRKGSDGSRSREVRRATRRHPEINRTL